MKVVWQQMAFLSDESRWAAEASECAGEQGRFWEYRERLFRETQGRGRGVFEPANLRAYAAETGLDGAAFGACLDSGRYTARVQAETEAARRFGVDRTPTLAINGRRLIGIPPLEELRALIRAARG